jgi:hypothetical protein
MEDAELERNSLSTKDAPWDTKIAFSWASLLMTVGHIADAM